MEFAFISVTSGGTTKPSDVHIVRSRSMRGVNKKQDSRRSQQAARRIRDTTDAELLALSANKPRCNTELEEPDSKQMVVCQKPRKSFKGTPETLPRLATLWQQAISAIDASKLGLSSSLSDRWLIPMACCENASSRELLVKCKFIYIQ